MRKKTKPENYLLLIIITCVLMLAGNYCLNLKNSQNTSYMNSGSIDFNKSTLAVKSGNIFIKINNKNAVLLRNGEPVSSEIRNGYLIYKICAYNNDVFEIDVRKCASKDVSTFVIDCDEGISIPQKGTKIIAQKGIMMLFKIVISD